MKKRTTLPILALAVLLISGCATLGKAGEVLCAVEGDAAAAGYIESLGFIAAALRRDTGINITTVQDLLDRYGSGELSRWADGLDIGREIALAWVERVATIVDFFRALPCPTPSEMRARATMGPAPPVSAGPVTVVVDGVALTFTVPRRPTSN